MTIQTFPNALGGTDYYITPPGLGPTGSILTLPKSSAISLALGARIVPSARLASGYSGDWATGSAAGLSAIVTTAAAAGTTTVQARLESFLAIGVTASKFQPNQGEPPSIYGDTVLSTVVKPSAENWVASLVGSLVYKYLSGVNFLYTTNLATASAALYAAHVGSVSINAGPGTIVGYIATARFAAQLSSQINETSTGLESIAVPVSGAAPVLGSNIYTNLDRTLVSATGPTLAMPNLLGVVIAQDKRVIPTIYSFAFGDTSPANVPFEVLCQAFGSAIDSVTRIAYAPSFGLIYSRAADGFPNVTDRLYAAQLQLPWNTTGNQLDNKAVQDFAYDPILPAPLDKLRIIWSQVNSGFSLTPSIIRRSASTPPIAGMVATGRVKAIIEKPEFNPGGIESFIWVSFSHGQSPVVAGIILVDTGYSVAQGPERVRAGIIAYSLAIIDVGLIASTVSAKWGQRNEDTGSYVVIPGYPAQPMVHSMATNRWSCIMPPISPLYVTPESIARYVIMSSINGSSYGFVGASGPGSNGNILKNITPVDNVSPASTISDGLPIYPFDILRASLITDAGGQWVGHRGWRFNPRPDPTITWSAGPLTVTLNSVTGVLTIPSSPIVTYSVPVGNGVLSAYSGTVQSNQMRLKYYRLIWLEVSPGRQPIAIGQSRLNYAATPITISSTFKPKSGTLTLRVIMYFTYLTPAEVGSGPPPLGGVPHPYAMPYLREYITDIIVP